MHDALANGHIHPDGVLFVARFLGVVNDEYGLRPNDIGNSPRLGRCPRLR
jgi:hypothetical protein